MDDHSGTRLARDAGGNPDLAESIYGLLPSRALDLSSADLRASSIPAKRLQDSKSSKRKGTSDADGYAPRISLSHYNGCGYWITTKTGKRGRLQTQKDAQTDMHQSTCLNLGSNNNESDLWILPDFDEWELEAESPQQEVSKRQNSDWAPLLERAVNSNRERLRRRLEGDGWDFVGGKYGEDGKGLKEVDEGSVESVDEEFDVVVLPAVQVAC